MTQQMKVVIGGGSTVVYAAYQPGAKNMTCSWKWADRNGIIEPGVPVKVWPGETFMQALKNSFIEEYNGIKTSILPVTGLPGHR